MLLGFQTKHSLLLCCKNGRDGANVIYDETNVPNALAIIDDLELVHPYRWQLEVEESLPYEQISPPVR